MSGKRARQLRQLALINLLGGGLGDTTAPTVAITSAAATITAAAFSVTITFTDPATGNPEAVTGFALGDITTSANASAGTFANPSTGVYTAVITPTATGTVTVDVAADVCTDAAGNGNTAATQFSILYVAADIWFDFGDITTLYQTNNTTTPVTADGQTIGYVADKSGSGFHGTQATAGKRPIYETNIQNGKSVARFTIANATALLYTPTNVTTGLTVFLVATPTSGTNGYIVDGGNWGAVITGFGGKSYEIFSNAGNDRETFSAGGTGINIISYKGDATHLIGRFNGSQVFDHATPGDMTGHHILSLGSNLTGTGDYFGGDVCELLAFDAYLSDAVMAAIETYLNTKWAVF